MKSAHFDTVVCMKLHHYEITSFLLHYVTFTTLRLLHYTTVNYTYEITSFYNTVILPNV